MTDDVTAIETPTGLVEMTEIDDGAVLLVHDEVAPTESVAIPLDAEATVELHNTLRNIIRRQVLKAETPEVPE